MNQKLSDLASIAEIIASVAVVVTLVVLISEVRGNTDEIRAAALTNLADRNQALMLTVLSSPHLADVYSQQVQGEELSIADELLLSQYFAATVKAAEESFIAYRDGRLDEEIWRTRAKLVLDMVASVHSRDLWEDRRDTGWYVQDFVDWFDAELAEAYDE